MSEQNFFPFFFKRLLQPRFKNNGSKLMPADLISEFNHRKAEKHQEKNHKICYSRHHIMTIKHLIRSILIIAVSAFAMAQKAYPPHWGQPP